MLEKLNDHQSLGLALVIYANTLYQTIAEQMAKTQPTAHKGISTNLTQLMKVWPSVTLPAAPTMTPDQVSQLIKTIELNTQKATT